MRKCGFVCLCTYLVHLVSEWDWSRLCITVHSKNTPTVWWRGWHNYYRWHRVNERRVLRLKYHCQEAHHQGAVGLWLTSGALMSSHELVWSLGTSDLRNVNMRRNMVKDSVSVPLVYMAQSLPLLSYFLRQFSILTFREKETQNLLLCFNLTTKSSVWPVLIIMVIIICHQLSQLSH